MAPAAFTLLVIASLVGLLALGIPIVIALGLMSFGGVAYVTGSVDTAISILSTTSYEALRDYVFAVIPLFILMGEFVARSGAASDLYNSINRAMVRVPGRLAVATVLGNAVFAAVVGVSVASAAAFSRIAYPAMCREGYDKTVSLGCIAGSSALGMLIPPSVLMIVWGVLTQMSIGKLFMAGFIPGLALAGMYAIFCIGYALFRPELFGGDKAARERQTGYSPPPLTTPELVGTAGCLLLIFLVLGGIWFGWFTPTEAAGIGALLALVLAVAKGMRWSGIREVISETGRTSAPILFLLIFAQMYSRLLALGGVGGVIQSFILGTGLSPGLIVLAMVLVWFVLGMFIDSVSIILLTVPIFAPIAAALGIDPLAFAIIGILAIEAGIITPPFGLAVFTVKACIDDPDVRLGQIFRGAAPYWVMLLMLAGAIYIWPRIASWLPNIT
jgi:C4-dicarboxylate transporter, DctM subunit